MDKDYSELWMNVVNATDRGEAVHILTGILLDEEGRSFIANLEGEEAELCVKILDHVSHVLNLFSPVVMLAGLARGSQSTASKPPRNRLSSSRG